MTADRGAAPGSRRAGAPCLWCGRDVPDPGSVGRRRRYCAQSCRQRAYEQRSVLARAELPADAIVLTAAERADLVDRLFRMRCAAEDVVTAVGDGADRVEVRGLLDDLLAAAREAERLR